MPQLFDKPLTIGLRYYSEITKKFSPEQLLYYINYLKTLKPTNIFLTTLENDPIIAQVKDHVTNVITIPQTERGFAAPVSKLIENAKGTYLLLISVGVELQEWQLLHGLEVLKTNDLLLVGWRINSQENDGSFVGRLAYNTCCLYYPDFYNDYKKVGGIPHYVENGVLGSIKIKVDKEQKEIPIGGQEEFALQLKIYKEYVGKKNKIFGHIAHYATKLEPLDGLGVDFESKVLRKMIVADLYCRTENINASDFMKCWSII